MERGALAIWHLLASTLSLCAARPATVLSHKCDIPSLLKCVRQSLASIPKLEKTEKRPFVHNSVCSQFLEGLFAISAECFAILFEVLLTEIQEEIHHFAGWEGGGSRGTKIVNKNFVNKLAFPKNDLA